MFNVARQKILDNTQWHSSPPNKVKYIEAWNFSDPHTATSNSLRHGFLHDLEIETWLSQTGAYAPPEPPNARATLTGGFRLLICEREFYRPLSFSMSKASFLAAEEKLHLPPATLLSLSHDNGVFSRYRTYEDADPQRLLRIGIVIKSPQKFQIANYGLSLSHDFSTGLTTALLHGTGAIDIVADHKAWKQSQCAQILELIENSPSLWAHPMLLPKVLMEHHIRRSEVFCTVYLEDELVLLQERLGVTQAGRRHRKTSRTDIAEEGALKQTRRDLGVLTADMSTYMTEAVWFDGLSEWQCDCMEFLNRTLEEVSGHLSATSIRETMVMREWVEYASAAARCLKNYNSKTKEATEPDFNVLHSLIAQIDNRLSAKMTASSSRDSTAMKALAFLTTIFLPGTFVATVFSTSMFDWLSPERPSSRIISSYFWVYWIITIPLTIIVATSWRLWWHWEKRNFDRDVLMEIDNINRPHLTLNPGTPDSNRAYHVPSLSRRGRESVWRRLWLNRFLGRGEMAGSLSATERGSVTSLRVLSGEYALRPEEDSSRLENGAPNPGVHYAQVA